MQIQDFLPEKQISIDVVHTLDQLTSRFRTVSDGLPELIKNSKDHYGRVGVDGKDKRQIVIIISEDKNRLGVLDFAGAKLDDFIGWKEWSSRIAGRQELSGDIEAGHGNGGKSFMARGCMNEATMCGYVDQKINKWGFKNNNPKLKYRAGIFLDKNGNQLKNYSGNSSKDVLNSELSLFGLTVDDLPSVAKKAFSERNRFTFVQLCGVRDWKGALAYKIRLINKIAENLTAHSQAALTIESSTVWIQLGKKLLSPKPLEVADFEPLEGLENIGPIPIPSILEDPETKQKVQIGKGQLVLKTANKNLRAFGHNVPRNVIRLKNDRNIVANWSVPNLVSMTTSGFIYGYLECASLTKDFLIGSDRHELINNELTRALKHWTAKQVKDLAIQIQNLIAVKNTEEEKKTASTTIDQLRELMKKYLEKLRNEGEGGSGKDKDEGDLDAPDSPGWGKKIDEIDLEPNATNIIIANGTTIPLVVKCYERKEEKRLPVRKFTLALCADSENIIERYKESSVKGINAGKTRIRFETENGKVRSKEITVEVVDIAKLNIEPPNHILKQGERVNLQITPINKKNQRVENLLYETSVDEIELAKISRYGIVVTGGIPGKATVRIRYGLGDDQVTSSNLEIGDEVVERKGGKKDSGIPYILICGDIAPNSEDLPEDSRTHPGGRDYPTIIDFEPHWENIIWINPESHEAIKVRSDKGSAAVGLLKISSIAFQKFLALKCFEILKRLRVKEQMGDNRETSQQFFQSLAEAEIDTSDFLESAYEIVNKLIEERKMNNG